MWIETGVQAAMVISIGILVGVGTHALFSNTTAAICFGIAAFLFAGLMPIAH